MPGECALVTGKVSKVMRGELTEFSTEQLMLLTRLGRDVEIRVKRVRGGRFGHITVAA